MGLTEYLLNLYYWLLKNTLDKPVIELVDDMINKFLKSTNRGNKIQHAIILLMLSFKLSTQHSRRVHCNDDGYLVKTYVKEISKDITSQMKTEQLKKEQSIYKIHDYKTQLVKLLLTLNLRSIRRLNEEVGTIESKHSGEQDIFNHLQSQVRQVVCAMFESISENTKE